MDRQIKELNEELDPIKNKVTLETSPAQWNKNTRHHREHIQRDLTRSEKEEEYNQDRPEQTNTTAKKTKHQRRFKRTLTHIINVSKYQLTHGETSF